jgi:hypothetical protein
MASGLELIITVAAYVDLGVGPLSVGRKNSGGLLYYTGVATPVDDVSSLPWGSDPVFSYGGLDRVYLKATTNNVQVVVIR